jgi:FkbM family methyltransferase
MTALDSYKRYKKCFRNYVSVWWNLFLKREFITIILRDGHKSKVTNAMAVLLSYLSENLSEINEALDYCEQKELDNNQVVQFRLLIKKGMNFHEALVCLEENKFSYKNTEVIMDGWLNKGISNNGDIIGIFIDEDYKFLNVKNKVVIDIGANIGDSPLYFALSEAKKVIALEPYPYSFNYALKNVEINNMGGKIMLLNAGYGRDSEIFVEENKITDLGTDLTPSTDGKKIKVYSLKTLMYDYNLNDELILKIDCEGCEYNLLNEDNETLRKFTRIQIEYHYGYDKIVNKLKECDFDVKYTKPKKAYIRSASTPNMSIGWIYAER